MILTGDGRGVNSDGRRTAGGRVRAARWQNRSFYCPW